MERRILHIGWGFVPWRSGGLVTYAHDLMGYQAAQGWTVDYFCAGRHYPFTQHPVLKEWRRGKVSVHEIVNSPILHGGDRGTLRPDLELSEPFSEQLFCETIDRVQPDVIHIHELAGLPSSLIDLAKDRYALPILMTLADYFLLCPTLKLFDAFGQMCAHEDLASACMRCCIAAPKSRRGSELMTILYRFKPLILSLPAALRRLMATALEHEGDAVGETGSNPIFSQRRQINLQRLARIDVLVARSTKVADLYRQHLGSSKKIEVINPTLRHIDRIIPRRRESYGSQLRFVTLNGLATTAKGGEVLLTAIEQLCSNGYGHRFSLTAFGAVGLQFRERLNRLKNIRRRGPYRTADLDRLLEGMDVGIVPSVWEEVFGYVGLEMLAKGIPVIGNAVGGITEYVKEHRTGWLNHSSTAEELAEIMAAIIDDPAQVKALNTAIVKERPLQTYHQHFLAMARCYHTAIANCSSLRRKKDSE